MRYNVSFRPKAANTPPIQSATAERSRSIVFSTATPIAASSSLDPDLERTGRRPARRPVLSRIAAAGALLLAFGTPAAGRETPPRAEFTVEGVEETDFAGTEVDLLERNVPHVSLSWSVPAGEESEAIPYVFTLQQDDSPRFSEPRTLYEGRDRSSFRGGLPEGNVFYRVRAAGADGESGGWSRPLLVQVEYQSMEHALALFALGGLVVLGTVVLVLAGTRKDREEARKEETAP